MKILHHLLVPIDFSEHSDRALQFAVDIAKQTGADITLLHAIEPPYNTAITIEGLTQSLEKKAKEELSAIRDRVIKELPEDRSVFVDVTHGLPVPAIRDAALECKADMIVMGSRGETGLKKILFGSIASFVSSKSEIPVLLIPGKTSLSKLNHLLFTTDFRKADIDNYQRVLQLANELDATTELFHVATDDSFETTLRERGFVGLIREHTDDTDATITVRHGEHILAEIARYISQRNDTIIVMNRYKKSILQTLFDKNVTDEMAGYASSPLLILPS
ncbi:MAG: universal stress protein [Balneolaceae bacterium]